MTLLELFARATVILAIAAILVLSFHRRAASTHHLLWTVAFLLLLALPVASYALPRLNLSILPSSMPPIDLKASLWASSTITSLLLLLWAAGCSVSLGSLVVGGLRYRSWVRSAAEVDDAQWRELLGNLRQSLGVRREVRLLESQQMTVPLVGGVSKPAILLPTSARTWSQERRRAVLAHELIHVRRHDPLRQCLSRLALAPYWFHPLGWLVSRWSVMAREQACDEGVLELGLRPTKYAGHLLDLALDQPVRHELATGLPLIRRPQLERRIRAILDPKRAQPSLALAVTLSALLAICSVATAVAIPMTPEQVQAEACFSPTNPLN